MAGKGVWRNITGGKIGEGKLGRGIGEGDWGTNEKGNKK
jgi:hypothetical protein